MISQRVGKAPTGSHRALLGGKVKGRGRRGSHGDGTGNRGAAGVIRDNQGAEGAIGRSLSSTKDRKIKVDSFRGARGHGADVISEVGPSRVRAIGREIWNVIAEGDGLAAGGQVGHDDSELDGLSGRDRIGGRRQLVGNRENCVDGFGIAGLGQILAAAVAKRCLEQQRGPGASRCRGLEV
jgi:hypothetical protein